MSQPNYTPSQTPRKPLPPELLEVFDRLVFIGRAFREAPDEIDPERARAFAQKSEQKQSAGGES